MEANIGKYIITSDERNYVVNVKKKIKGEVEIVPIGYFSTLKLTMKFITERTIRTNKNIDKIMKELNNIEKMMEGVEIWERKISES